MGKYSIFVQPDAWQAAKQLPGNVRQRVKRFIDDLKDDARPAHTKRLETTQTVLEVRRLRLDDWRVLYAVNEELKQVQVFAIRQRPPYDYADLGDLLSELE
jgi:mRNA interferase RelE/StbE